MAQASPANGVGISLLGSAARRRSERIVRAVLLTAALATIAISAFIIGTLIVTAIAMVIAAPVGLASAIYLSEYASPRVRRIVKPILEVLAGIPSVVLGFFALTVITPSLIKPLLGDANTFNLAAAGIGVGILSVPLVASVAEDAMRAVPRSLREASHGLGARKITASLQVVFPAAVSGLVAALILAASRAMEQGPTLQPYTNPKNQMTEDYVSGRFG